MDADDFLFVAADESCLSRSGMKVDVATPVLVIERADPALFASQSMAAVSLW